MQEWTDSYKTYFGQKNFLFSSIISFVLLLMSLVVNFYAGVFASERASNAVTDIILSNIRVYDVDGIFIYGSWVLVIIIGLVCFRYPWKIPFILKSIALFVLTRSVFITLTHIGPFLTTDIIRPKGFLSYFVFGGDLFFSGHTGLPFLLSLIFWKEKILRTLFLLSSFVFGSVVLLAHLHYSIDVLSAYFITFTIYHIALKLFKKEKEIFDSGQIQQF